MTNSTTTKTILSTLAATVIATTFSVSAAMAEGGGGEQANNSFHKPNKNFVTLHNKDGSSKTVRGGCCGTRFVEKRNKRGQLTMRKNYRPDRSSWAASRDPKSGKTYVSGRTQQGNRFSFTISPFGGISIGINR